MAAGLEQNRYSSKRGLIDNEDDDYVGTEYIYYFLNSSFICVWPQGIFLTLAGSICDELRASSACVVVCTVGIWGRIG